MRREERVTVHGPVKEQQPDGMSHRGGGGAQLLVHHGTAPLLWSPRRCARSAPAGREASAEQRQIADILQRANVVRTEIKKADYAAKDVAQDLGRLLVDTATAMADMELKVAMQAMAALVKFLDLVADDTNHEQFRLKREVGCLIAPAPPPPPPAHTYPTATGSVVKLS